MNKEPYEYDMNITDSPYIDILVFCTKTLGMNLVMKNENEALHYEDSRSRSESANYIKYMDGNWDKITQGDYDPEQYMEWNSYYRMLNGEPPAYTTDEEQDYLQKIGASSDYANNPYVEDLDIDALYMAGPDTHNKLVVTELFYRYWINMEPYANMIPEDMPALSFNSSTYLHQLSDSELTMIEIAGIYDVIVEEYGDDPHYQYIYHLHSTKRVDYYTARKAENFALLYLPTLSGYYYEIIEQKFRRYFERNREFTLSTIYSEAYRFMSYHYDAFMMILIIIQTMVDIISEVQEYIINKEIFDSRTIRYLFESYGIEYYKEIPTRYQIRIIKNVYLLLKYKSSHRNITDILTLFDNNNISVYTYYLMKIKKIPRVNFHFYGEEDINPIYVSDATYYLGNPNDLSNELYPVCEVDPTQDDEDFIKTYILNYEKTEDDIVFYNGSLTTQFISFIKRYLDENEWFINTSELARQTYYNNPTNQQHYLDMITQRFNEYLYKFITEYSGSIIDPDVDSYSIKPTSFSTNSLSSDDDDITLHTFRWNKYWIRAAEWMIMTFLGVFDFNEYFTYTKTDTELANCMLSNESYMPDTYASYRAYDITVPFLNRIEYNNGVRYPDNDGYGPKLGNYVWDNDNNNDAPQSLYIFGNSGSFGLNTDPELTESFRSLYYTWARSLFLTNEYKIFPEQLITSRYDGWISIGYVNSILKTDEIVFGVEVYIDSGTSLPIYSEPYIEQEVTQDMIGVEYYTKNYDACFLRVPMLDPNAYNVIEDKTARRSYDSITLNDPFWDGVTMFDILTDEDRDELHLTKYREILNKEFTIERTKYIAVEADIDMKSYMYQICYFMNMLYDKNLDEENITIKVNRNISTSEVRLNDLFTFIYALGEFYLGNKDLPVYELMEQNKMIYGFNMNMDWTEMYHILQHHRFIMNNYANYDADEEREDYEYTNEYGEVVICINGYGTDEFGRGYATELYSDWYMYTGDDAFKEVYTSNMPNGIGYYLGEPNGDIIGITSNGLDIYDNNREYNWLELYPNPLVGAFVSGRYEQCRDEFYNDLECIYTENFKKKLPSALQSGFNFGYSDIWTINLKKDVYWDITTNKYYTVDASWETQYPENDNNSHGLWLNTNILNNLTNAESKELLTTLEQIYYSNTNMYDHLQYMMIHAENKRQYEIYHLVYDSFMSLKMCHEYYNLVNANGDLIYEGTDSNGNTATYTLHNSEFIIIWLNGQEIIAGIDIDYDDIPAYTMPVYEVSWIEYDEATDTVTEYDEYVHLELSSNGDLASSSFVNEDGTFNIPVETDKITGDAITLDTIATDLNHAVVTPSDLSEDDSTYKQFSRIVKTTTASYFQNNNDASDRIFVEVNDNTGEIIIPEDTDIHPKLAKDYYEFMQYRNPDLYALMIDLKYNYNNENELLTRIDQLCEYIIEDLEKYMDSAEWKWLFNLIPTNNAANVQNYIMKMIIFFKSWKTQILDTSINYIIDDPYENRVFVIDDMYLTSKFELVEKVRPRDFVYLEITKELRDPIYIGEKESYTSVYNEEYDIGMTYIEQTFGARFDYPAIHSSPGSDRDAINIGDKVTITTYTTDEVEFDDKGNLL